ncbi:hypothetical protein SUGI_0505970 [Cryptomeria japonica]|uniref:uncharacterized protein LOC131060466 n=1 Tax=Cryptomeria japonica TaxID=3369 RepID=UPI002408ACC3|nr:uncharacterized protein LOC131060466 [Cryptomeria japonica]GLJ26309.1 hypothetical protein SUGI_0505970 [Cryptomeria japonica]
MAAALGGLAIALSIVFGALVLVLLAEVYYVFYWKRHRAWNRRSRIISEDAERERGFDLSRETGLVSSLGSPSEVTKLCSGVMGSNSSLYMQGVLGGPRLLFTIKEETMEDMEHDDDDEKHQRKYAYSIGLISQKKKKVQETYYNSLRAMSPALQPITTYSKSVFFHSSASETSMSPVSGRSFSQPSSPPLRYHRCGSLSSPSWLSSSCSTSPSVSERRFEPPSLSPSPSPSQRHNYYISNPIYEGDNFSSCRARLSSQNTTPFATPLSSPSWLVQPWDTPPLTPPLSPIRAPLAAYSHPLLNSPSLIRNFSGSTNSSPPSKRMSP